MPDKTDSRKERERMPKTNLAQSVTKRREDYLRGLLAGGKARTRKSTKDIAEKLNMSERTLCRWFDSPEMIQIGELYHICDELGLQINIGFKNIPE